MTSVFWADERSRVAYSMFHDVLLFDLTYKTNKFRMPFAAFTGINHPWLSIYLVVLFWRMRALTHLYDCLNNSVVACLLELLLLLWTKTQNGLGHVFRESRHSFVSKT